MTDPTPQLTQDTPPTATDITPPPRAAVRRQMQLQGSVGITLDIPSDTVLSLDGLSLCQHIAQALEARLDTLSIELSGVIREGDLRLARLDARYIPELFATHTRLDAYERLADRYDTVVELKFGDTLVGHYFSPEGLQLARVQHLIQFIDALPQEDQNSLSLIRQELQQSLDDGNYFEASENAEPYLVDVTPHAFSTRRMRPSQALLDQIGVNQTAFTGDRLNVKIGQPSDLQDSRVPSVDE